MYVNLNEIPEYLKNSELYRNFLENSDGNDIITINPNHNVKDIIINSFEDLCNYLDIYRYWMLDDYIKELFYNYVKNNQVVDIDYLKSEFYQLDIIEELEHIKNFNKDSCNFAAKKGNVDLLDYLHQNNCLCESIIYQYAAFYGHLNILKYLHKNSHPWNILTCYIAAGSGNLNCLIFAHENGAPWDEWTSTSAASNGHLNCLRYAHENNCSWDKWTCAYAAKEGHLNCLIYLHENGCSWDKLTILNAKNNNHLNCLQYALENGCSI